MYFTICTPLHPYEVMMQGIPNFLPRGHGTYIYRREIVPSAQTDCQYCLYYHSGKCSLEECPFLELKIANGTAGVRQIMSAVFSAVTYPPFICSQPIPSSGAGYRIRWRKTASDSTR